MKNHNFQELVDQNLSGLVWDERKRQAVLYAISEEEKPVKKISTTFILIAAIICISVTALAAGLVFSGRFDAVKVAEKTINDSYGITNDMLGTFFSRSTEEKSDGTTLITFSGIDYFHYVLGDYTVTVQNGEGVATWNHDGEDTSRLFEADAWGKEQLQEMMRLSAEDHDVTAFAEQARAIAAKYDATPYRPASSNENYKEGEEEAKAAAKAAGRTGEDLVLLATEAVTITYNLTPEQSEMLVDPAGTQLTVDEIGDYMYYHMQEGKPIFTVMLSLHQKTSDDLNVTPPFTEKDGVYWVDVNVETGVIENILYDTQLGGNG